MLPSSTSMMRCWAITASLLCFYPAASSAQLLSSTTQWINTGTCALTGGPTGTGSGDGAGPLFNSTTGVQGSGNYGTASSENVTSPGGAPISTSPGVDGNGHVSGNGEGPTNNTAEVAKPIDSRFGIYTFQGVYSVPSNGNIFNGNAMLNATLMSAGLCASMCQGTPYFAVVNGNECDCGTEAPSGSLVDSLTPTPCPDNTPECDNSLAFVYKKSNISNGSGTTILTSTSTDSLGQVTTGTFNLTFSTYPTGSGLTTIVYTSTKPDGELTTGSSTSTIFVPTTHDAQPSTTSVTGTGSINFETATASSDEASPSNGESTATQPLVSNRPLDISTTPEAVVSSTSLASFLNTSTPYMDSSSTDLLESSGTSSSPSLELSTSTSSPSPMESNEATVTSSPTNEGSSSTDADTLSSTASATQSAYTYTGSDPEVNHVPVCNDDNNTRYTDIFAAEYDIKCGVNLNGHQGLAAHADAFVDCLEYCDILEGCSAVSFLPNPQVDQMNCYPYLVLYGYEYNSTTTLWGAIPTAGPTTGEDFTEDLCATTNDYKSYNQSVFTDIFGNNYFIGCNQMVEGTGYGGQDMASTVTTTFLGCVTYCSTYQHCTGVDWNGFAPGQDQANCFPKYTTGNVDFQDQTSYAVLQQG